MALTKQHCFNQGEDAWKLHRSTKNPFREGSWQSRAWIEGNTRAKAEEPVEDPMPYTMGNLAPFPDRMPHPTREHITALNARALETKDSTVALRLDRKITVLYQRYA